MPLSLILYAPPVLLIAAAAIGGWSPSRWGRTYLSAIEALSIAGLIASIASVAALVVSGSGTAVLAGTHGWGMSSRLDVISVTMLTLVSFVGWVVVRYSTTYLDGEPRQHAFMGWLCATLAMVMLLVISGNLAQLLIAFVATSLCLHKLLLFYADRVAAQRAARKKFVTARIADFTLAAAVILLGWHYGTGDIASLLAASQDGAGGATATAAAALIALAALLKSAQFPIHGWLTEVMEAPTPVSALLHAGVINAGGFLLIRFADVMLLSPGVLAVLAMIGGFTALFAGMVMLTQPAVKTSLAWSTIAQMGFMIMQCGLALFPLALLHIVAHSLYKAHSFLASGGAVQRIEAAKRPGPVAVPDWKAVGQAFLAAIALYAVIGLAFGIQHKSPQAVALGAILIFGIAYLLAQGLADAAPRALMRRMVVYASAASVGYFALHAIAFRATTGTLPQTPQPGALEWALLILAVTSFGLVAVAQSLFPLWSSHPSVAGLRVHLSNGLYANAIFDRLLGGWSTKLPLSLDRSAK